MKKYFFILGLIVLSLPAAARHVAGGELMYEYLGPGPDGVSSNYKITLRLFRECESNGPSLESERVWVGFYANGVKVPYDLFLPQEGNVQTISLNTAGFPCLVGQVSVCYQMALYSRSVTLPNNDVGYTLSTLGCCRVDGISNLVPGPSDGRSASIGSNYVTYIPGTNALPAGEHNNCPRFNVRDTALVCANKKFTLDFGAVDADGDSLTFSFCEAFTSGLSGTGIRPIDQLSALPLPYVPPYSGASPLGYAVTINQKTGIISGIAPSPGKYVVNVCITEWRKGKAFSQHRKDFLLKVQDCDFIEADLPYKIIQCKDSIVHFENGSTSASIRGYLWDFGDKTATSNAPLVDHPYKDTGRYLAHLTVYGPQGCVGIDSTEVLVYPGFNPAFKITGSCYFQPYQFSDSTTTRYGFVDSWYWDFGDPANDADTSIIQNPTYKYNKAGTRNIRFIVTNSKGCIDSLHRELVVRDKPLVNLPFRDTLICATDTLAIPVSGPGTYSWLPNKNILFENTANPLVFPNDTTRYIVTLVDQGCTNTDTVTVNVLQFITVNLGIDSLICQTDIIQLHPVSYGLQYQWKSSSGEIVAPVKYPFVKPLADTKYYVTAHLGNKCQAMDTVLIRTVPYPTIVVSPDTAICLGNRIILRSTMTAAYINWTPASSLTNFTTRFPTAGPSKTTTYIAVVRDTLGCPKTASDSVVVTVAPPVKGSAGKDTFALIGQPLVLQGEGGVSYSWSPESYLSDISVANPTALFPPGVDSMRYFLRVSDQYGCYMDDNVLVTVFRTGPEIFVPTAFTPNADGRNDVLRPITVGITTLNFFRVYNRYGQLLFSTSEIGKGWDGIFNGYPQPSGAYVYQTQGVDYTGKVVFRKGTAVLIR